MWPCLWYIRSHLHWGDWSRSSKMSGLAAALAFVIGLWSSLLAGTASKRIPHMILLGYQSMLLGIRGTAPDCN